METETLPDEGLCNSLCYRGKDGFTEYDERLNLFKPIRAGDHSLFWGFDFDITFKGKMSTSFGPMRQTIMLFLAAMNDEL